MTDPTIERILNLMDKSADERHRAVLSQIGDVKQQLRDVRGDVNRISERVTDLEAESEQRVGRNRFVRAAWTAAGAAALIIVQVPMFFVYLALAGK